MLGVGERRFLAARSGSATKGYSDDRLPMTDRVRRLAMRSLVLVLLSGAVASAAPSSKCVVEVVATPPVPKTAAPCHRAPAATEAAIRAAIAKRYEPEHDGGKSDVKFGCDGLGPQIREIVIEGGSGHGGSLTLWSARRNSASKYDVRGIVYQGTSMVKAASKTPYQLASATVAIPDLELVRAVLGATVSEVAPPPPPGMTGGMRGSSSSHDFHLLVRLTDDDGRVLERQYTGYAGSSDQDRYLGLEVANEALGVITSIASATGTPNDEDRALFNARFAASVPHFDDQFYWWVMERQVDLARFLGTPATIGGLLTRLTIKKSDRSKVDARANAVDALAKITGWDARAGGKSVEQAAARYLAECRSK
jgi:hypothetical protein